MSLSRIFQQNKRLLAIGGGALATGAGLWWYETKHNKDVQPILQKEYTTTSKLPSEVIVIKHVELPDTETESLHPSHEPLQDTLKLPKEVFTPKPPPCTLKDAIAIEIRKLDVSPEMKDKIKDFVEVEMHAVSDEDIPFASKMTQEERERQIADLAKQSVAHAKDEVLKDAKKIKRTVVKEGVKEKAHELKEAISEEKEKLKNAVKFAIHGREEHDADEVPKEKHPPLLETLKGKKDQVVGAIETRVKDTLGHLSKPSTTSESTKSDIPPHKADIADQEEPAVIIVIEEVEPVPPPVVQAIPTKTEEKAKGLVYRVEDYMEGKLHDLKDTISEIGRKVDTEHNIKIDVIEERDTGIDKAVDRAVDNAKSAAHDVAQKTQEVATKTEEKVEETREKTKDLLRRVEDSIAHGKDYVEEKAKEAEHLVESKLHGLKDTVKEIGRKIDTEHNIKIDVVQESEEPITEKVTEKAKEVVSKTEQTVKEAKEKATEVARKVEETVAEKAKEAERALEHKVQELADTEHKRRDVVRDPEKYPVSYNVHPIPDEEQPLGLLQRLEDKIKDVGRKLDTEHNIKIDVVQERETQSIEKAAEKTVDLAKQGVRSTEQAAQKMEQNVKELGNKFEENVLKGKDYVAEKTKEAEEKLREKFGGLSESLKEIGRNLDTEHNIKYDVIEQYGEDIPEKVKRKVEDLKEASVKVVQQTEHKLSQLSHEVKEKTVEPIKIKYEESKDKVYEKAKEARDQAAKEKEINEARYGSYKEQAERLKQEVKETTDHTIENIKEISDEATKLAADTLKKTASTTVHVAKDTVDKVAPPVLSTYERAKEAIYRYVKDARDRAATLKEQSNTRQENISRSNSNKEYKDKRVYAKEELTSPEAIDEVMRNP